MEPVDSLFRRESGRLVAVLTRIFGVHNLALAEDVVQDAFCHALEVWPFRGMPADPSAWLMTTAKNRAVDVLRRDRTARTFAPELSQRFDSEWTLVPTVEEQFSADAMEGDLLRMMFSCCHPRLKEEAQIALMLHVLCGFSVREVAGAFVASHASIEKRIQRAKSVLAESQRLFDIGDDREFTARLPAVQRALYLLFNEGYHGSSAEFAVRSELCAEALRLATLLCEHPRGGVPATLALAALMHLNAARLPARTDANGDLRPLSDQDRSLWDRALVADGQRLLEQSASGAELSEYHVEAAISWVHATAASAEDTDWKQIVTLYDQLMGVRPSPVVALNRAIAVAQSEGPERGLEEIREIADPERLTSYPFYAAAQGELELRRGAVGAARNHFQTALMLARNEAERRFFEQRVSVCSDSAN